jgi:hypothetical protein
VFWGSEGEKGMEAYVEGERVAKKRGGSALDNVLDNCTRLDETIEISMIAQWILNVLRTTCIWKKFEKLIGC